MIEIKHRFTGKVLFSVEADFLKLAVEAAVSADADLEGADLRGAYLRGADLEGAYLRGADLEGAYLRGADLSGADLSGADLSGADLSGADLSGADLRGAYLRDADLSGADLSGAEIADDITITNTPIQLLGLIYDVIIFDKHIKIGCEFHSMADWFCFCDKRIAEMDGKNALNWWRQWNEPLRQICISSGRYGEKEQAA